MKRMLKVALCLTTALSVVSLVGCSKETMTLKEDEKTVEYGKSISTKAKDYLSNGEEFLKDVKVTGIPKNEKDKEYPAVGKYEITLTHGDAKEKVKIVVKDTTKPEFEDLKETYETAFGTKLSVDVFKAKDLAETTITLDDSNVDYQKAGNYQATVTVEDASKNKTEKEITVTVKEEEKQEAPASNPSGGSANNAPSYNGNAASSNSSSGSTISSGNSAPEQKPNYTVGNSGMLFNTEAEAIAWADNYLMEHIETWDGYCGWSTYDKWTIDFYTIP